MSAPDDYAALAHAWRSYCRGTGASGPLDEQPIGVILLVGLTDPQVPGGPRLSGDPIGDVLAAVVGAMARWRFVAEDLDRERDSPLISNDEVRVVERRLEAVMALRRREAGGAP